MGKVSLSPQMTSSLGFSQFSSLITFKDLVLTSSKSKPVKVLVSRTVISPLTNRSRPIKVIIKFTVDLDLGY